MDLKKVGWETWNWIDLALDGDWWWALVIVVLNLQVPYNMWNFLTT
jgi:hypothetical protein